MGFPRRNELHVELLMTIRISHRLSNGLQKVSGKHGRSADENLARTPSSGYETSESGKKFLSR